MSVTAAKVRAEQVPSWDQVHRRSPTLSATAARPFLNETGSLLRHPLLAQDVPYLLRCNRDVDVTDT